LFPSVKFVAFGAIRVLPFSLSVSIRG
jgi:hypothetical protein